MTDRVGEAACRYAQQGKLEKLKRAFERLENGDLLDRVGGKTCLHYAVLNGHLDVVRFLVATSKCDVNVRTRASKTTPLTIAQNKGYHQIASLLLANGATENNKPHKKTVRTW